MGWNYRVVRHQEADGRVEFKLHTAWYEGTGPERAVEVMPWPATPMAASEEELKEDLLRMTRAFHYPVLEAADVLPQEEARRPGGFGSASAKR